jgi:putative colanic acid biosynthesis acetyltransferase WcaF
MAIKNNDPYTEPSFGLGNRFARVVWAIVCFSLFKYSPRPCHRWRALLLRIFGAKLGRNVHVYRNVKVWAPWNLRVGDNVGIGDGANIYNMDRIEIGNYCVVSQGAHLCGGSHDYNSSNFQLFAKPIVLNDYVWICAEAFISLGVTVPTGAVIGARAVVTRTLNEPWSVYAGNPCRKIGVRRIRR